MNRSPLILIKLLSLLFVLGLMTGCGAGINTNSSEASPKAQLAVRDAYSQMGKPYRLGGASPRQGFDCSGLIYWAYGKNGVKVPRRTTDQLTAGHKVARNAPLPGDIVVFRMGGASLSKTLPEAWRWNRDGCPDRSLADSVRRIETTL